MLEKSDIAENAVECLHNEQYDSPYNQQNLNHEGMIFMGGRHPESLGGKWRFTLDLHDTGLRQKWFQIEPFDHETCTNPYDYDPHSGEEITVPSCWQMEREKWFYFEGSAWYTRDLDYQPEQDNENVFLRIGAANYDCKIFLNHQFIGNHYGGSTPFFADFTGKLRTGRNLLMICVNNARTEDRIPMRNNDWFNYGGIHREIELVRTPKDYIKDLFIYLVPNGQFNTVRADITTIGEVSEVELAIEELGIRTRLPVIDGNASTELTVSPKLWSPEAPILYDIEVQIPGGDKVTDRVGFREIRVDGTTILLNGQPVYLRGINCHEDDEKLGRLTNEFDIRRRFAHAKELNCNYMRLAHYPHHEMAAQIADEMGIMLWEEIPVYWSIAFHNPQTRRDGKNQMLELIKRGRNRASVIIWSVGNENADTDERLDFMTDLVKATRSADPTRLVTAACLVNHAKMKIEDRLADYLDVIGLNEYYGWYEEDFNDLIVLGKNSAPTKPVVISETGAEGMLGSNAPKKGAFSETYMADVYRKQTEFLPNLDYIKGFTPWILYDFRAERRQNPYQNGYNCKGLIGADKQTRKSAFYVLRDFYAKLAQQSLSDN
ncbi:glycoside hydrolase family 2 protein [Photobacterium sp. GSS17]|uniref:glycoside hydrolase family 2 protein n=1 Tax=Photobacterium sp. GSS17 TaxID=3020715 RepID=UPI00235E2AC5|nr:glycoside hydrolase family 2 TIM barrel-domain containing protein [Photobacterium sp. GSS17]